MTFAINLGVDDNRLIVKPIGTKLMTAGYAIGIAIRRVIMGTISGVSMMAVVGWTADYLEMIPTDPEATRYAVWLFFSVAAVVAILGLRACKIALLSVPLFCLITGLVLSAQELHATGFTSDLNGDGVYTIRDFAVAVFGVIVATGSWYLTFLSDETGLLSSTISTFFEVPLWVVDVPAKILFTAIWWGIFVFGWTRLIWGFELSHLRPSDS